MMVRPPPPPPLLLRSNVGLRVCLPLPLPPLPPAAARSYRSARMEMSVIYDRADKTWAPTPQAMGTSIQTVPTVGLSVKTMKHAGVSQGS